MSSDDADVCDECKKPPKGVTMGPEDEGWSCPYCGHYNEFEEPATDGETVGSGSQSNSPQSNTHQGTAHRVAAWIADVNSRETADQPLGWIDGRYHSVNRLTHLFNEEHDDADMSTAAMAAALTVIRDNPEDFDITVEYEEYDSGNKGAWQVYKGRFANV